MNKKQLIIFLAMFSLLACLVFGDAFLLKSTFMTGDYFQQFYPWTQFYAESIKDFNLPLWTSQVQSGFPLFAEGQTGMLYPLNLVLFFLLPFKMAFNASFFIHFILAGFFMYLYSRKTGAGSYGAFLAAIILCFGSVYGGGFINLSTLKSLCFFPLILFLFEKYLGSHENKIKYFMFIGVLWGIQLLAGSFQMTFYNICFCMLYFFYRNFAEKEKSFRLIKYIAMACCIALFISIPQIYSTMEISQYSSRAARTLNFALWNSFSPPALLGTFLPAFGSVFNRTNVIYIGVLSMFFVIVSLYGWKHDRYSKGLLLMLAAGLFVALGKFNPLYIVALKLTKFYSFRGPAKAIYFVVFALAAMSGKGFTLFFTQKIPADSRKAAFRIFAYLTSGVILAFGASRFILKYYGENILSLLKAYTKKYIYGDSFHRYDLDYYMDKVEGMYSSLSLKLSFDNSYILYGLLMMGIAVLLVYYLVFKEHYKYGKYVCIGLILIDLVAMNFYFEGPRSALIEFDQQEITHERLFDTIKKDGARYRVFPFGDMDSLPKWSYFSANMIYGIDSIGLYTPLMNRDYYLKLKDLGVVDDSLGAERATGGAIEMHRELLEKLNVKYIVSSQELEHDFLKNVDEEDGIYLYRLDSYYPRFWFLTDSGSERRVEGSVKVNEYRSGFADIEVTAMAQGYLVFSEKYYPGWHAYIDGKEVGINRYMDVIQSIKVPAGKHNIIMEYKPHYLKTLFAIQGGTILFLVVLLAAMYALRSKEGRAKG